MNLFIYKANSRVNITNVVNGTYNTSSVLVNFTVENRTGVYINVTNDKGENVYYNFTDKNHIIFTNLDAGKYLIVITNMESANYNATFNSTYFWVLKADTFVNVTQIINGTYNTTNAIVGFDVLNRTKVTVIVTKNGTNVVVYNNTNFTSSIFTIGNLSAGVYNITITNNETDNYNQYIKSVLFTVYKAQSKVVINDVVNGYYNTTNATVDFDVFNRTDVTIIVTKNGTDIVVYNNTNFNGTHFSIGNLSAGVYNITIINNEHENFTMSNTTGLFTVYKVGSYVNITNIVNSIYNTTNAVISFDVVNRTDVTIIIFKNGTTIKLVNIDNFADSQFSIGNLSAGVYNITIINHESENYTMSNASALFTVYKASSFVNITNILNVTYNTADIQVNYTVINLTSIKVIIMLNGTDVPVYEEFITGNFTIGTLGAGLYKITIINTENENYTIFNASALFSVYKAPSFVNITDVVNSTYNTTNVTVNFDITNRTDVTIIIQKNGTEEIIILNNITGNTFEIGNLTAGVYNITVINNEHANYTMSMDSHWFNVNRANSIVNITQIINGTYNTTDVVIDFNVVNRTDVSIVITDALGDIVYEIDNFMSSTFRIGNLSAGLYNITIYNALSDDYNASNITKSFEVIKASSKVSINNITNGIFNTTQAIVNFDVTNRTLISIFVYKNGTDICVFNSTDFKGTIFAIGNLTPGIYNITIYNNESANYNASQISGIFEVLKAPSFVNITEIISGIYNTTNATVKFDVTNKTNVKILVYKNGTDICVFNSTNFLGSEFSIGNLTAGIYNITITNEENANYTEYITCALFTVYKASSFVNITDVIAGVYNTTNATVKFDITNRTDVKIIVIKDQSGNVVYINDNFTGSEFSIGNLTAGVYNITITNLGDDNYNLSSNSTLFTVYKANSKVEIKTIVNATYNTTTVEVAFDITNRTTVLITITNASGTVVYTTDNFDASVFTIDNLNAGVYNITISNNVGDNYNASSHSALFEVFKAVSSLNIISATNSTYKVTSTVVTVNVINKTSVIYIIKNESGKIVAQGNLSDAPINFENLIGHGNTNDVLVFNNLGVGTYNITVINIENNNYLSSSDSATFTIIKSFSQVNITGIHNGTLDSENVTVKFNVTLPSTVSIIVTDSNGVVVYNNTDFKGDVFSIGNLTTGIYNITIINAEDDNVYSSNASGLFKVVVPTTIPSEDISRGYNSPYDYKAVFTDEFGNILNNTNVSMIVNGKIYNLTTDENGVAYLNDTLAVGKHDILLINPVSGENRTHIVTIVERLQENKDIVMDFCDGTYYSVRAYGDDAKPIAGVTVTITVNGVSYDVVTNADGYALLKIRLNPKTYTITAEWKDYKINKLVVRQTLKAKSMKVKKSANKFKYSASLKLSNGKPIVGKIIIFKFKGKTYKAKTNKKGIAKITINKKVLSKLIVGKKYKINVTYNHVDNGYTSVNSIIKKIVVKA